MQRSLESDSPIQRKLALQRLCSLYRNGGRFTNELVLKGCVLQCLTDVDAKVKRWAFNSLAQFGSLADVPLIEGAWRNTFSDPDIFSAGLTTLAKLLSKDKIIELLNKSQVDLTPSIILTLGQQTDSYDTELRKLRLNLDSATEQELREATLLIGLNRAPDTLFSFRHPVSSVIGDLNTHPNPIIAQYSFWATYENSSLNLSDVRILPEHFSDLPPNVQGWAYRLLTKGEVILPQYHDIIVSASESVHVLAREGMAIGLRDVFYDGLDTIILDWDIEENNALIKDHLLDHMARNSHRSIGYREEILRVYRSSSPSSILRARIEAANTDEQLSLELRKIALQTSDPDLFSTIAGTQMTNTMNFNSTVNAGGISNSGTGNIGTVNFKTASEAQEESIKLLNNLIEKIEKSDTEASSQLTETKTLSQEAAKSPTQSTVGRVVSTLKTLKEGGDSVGSIAHFIAKSYDNLSTLLQYLPTDI
ncbi:hypothetical protein [Zymomonas mobilis]|uniref:hypothetical protein n=1 Tax=Zymomonas mobilis TaxID=542 RepID=UPI0039EC2D54